MSKYRIGHPAYTHENRMTFADSKTAAIREMRSCGCKRDDAREAIKRADKGSHSGCFGGRMGYNPIEIIAVL